MPVAGTCRLRILAIKADSVEFQVGKLAGESARRVMVACERCVDIALGLADFGDVKALAIDETSRARGHGCVTLAAGASERRVLLVAEGRDAKTIKELAADLDEHGCPPDQTESVSIDMSLAFNKGVSQELPNARITVDKLRVVWHANAAVDKMRRIEPPTDKSLKGMRWSLLGDGSNLTTETAANVDTLIVKMTTARVWACKEQLREILERTQINVVRGLLGS